MIHTYDDLLALVDAADVVVDQGPPAAADSSTVIGGATIDPKGPNDAIQEADDDPHRLARVNLARYATRNDGRTIAFWKNEWYVWKKNAYRKIDKDEFRAKLSKSIKEEFDRIAREAQAMAADNGKDDSGEIKTQKVSMALVSNVIQATSGMVCISGDTEINTWLPTKEPRQYTSMANGLVDINAVLADRDDYLQPNTPQWFSLVSLPYAFDPDATCPRWEAFLQYNLAGDVKLISIAQEWAGYLLLPTTDEQKFLILEGEGKNGKSVFIAGLTSMLGVDNVSTVPLELFGNQFALSTSIGKLLNAAGDCGDLDKAAEGTLKQFVSGDRMFFDRKGISGVVVANTARLMLACNTLPRFSDRTDGVWRRMLVIPWETRISKEKQIKGMDKATWWQASGELPGIFVWALKGLARLRRQGDFSESDTMNKAIEEHKNEANPTRLFLQENVEEKEAGIIPATELYRIYKKWIDENGYRPLSANPFGKEVRRRFKNMERLQRGGRLNRFWVYGGIGFSQDEICGEKTDDAALF